MTPHSNKVKPAAIAQLKKVHGAERAESLPATVLAEQAVIGSIMQNNGTYSQVMRIVRNDDFSVRAHHVIMGAIGEMIVCGKRVDVVTLAAALEVAGTLAEVGGLSYLVKIDAGTPSSANALEYARHVASSAAERRIGAAGTRLLAIQRTAATTEEKIELAKEVCVGLFFDARQKWSGHRTMAELLHQSVMDLRQRALDTETASSGYRNFDEALGGGLGRENVIVLAGRASAGATSFALSVAENLAFDHTSAHACLFLSSAISASFLAINSLSRVSGVAIHKIRKGTYSSEEKAALEKASKKIVDAKLMITDIRTLQLAGIRQAVMEFGSIHGMPRLVVIDRINAFIDRAEENEQFDVQLQDIAQQLRTTMMCVYRLPDRNAEPALGELYEHWNPPTAASIAIIARNGDTSASITASRRPFMDAHAIAFQFNKETCSFMETAQASKVVPMKGRHAS